VFLIPNSRYTVVKKTLNEWNDWQMRNINAIVWLYRGETNRYRELISSYRMWLNDFFNRYDNAALHTEEKSWQAYREGIEATLSCFKGNLKNLEAQMKATRKRNEKAELKELVEQTSLQVAEITEALDVINQLIWLVEKFGEDGVYRDISGLCRIADISEVEGKKFSLSGSVYRGRRSSN